MTTTTHENVTGPINRESLSLLGWKHSKIESAELAAKQAAEDGYARVVIQKVGARRLQEGRSEDEDDHWVAAPGVEYFVWVDEATMEAKHAESRRVIDARHAIVVRERLERFARLMTEYQATTHGGFIMTGTRFVESMTQRGHGDVVNAAIAAGKIEALRSVVIDRNAAK